MTDDLTNQLQRTVDLLGNGYRIANIARAKRAQERNMLTAAQRDEARADIARIDRDSEDRDAAEIIRSAEYMATMAEGAVTVRVHSNRIARALARLDGAEVLHYADTDGCGEFWTVRHEGVVAFSTEGVGQ